MALMPRIAVLAEVVVVFLVGAVCAPPLARWLVGVEFLDSLPQGLGPIALRWGPLLLLAWIIERALRQRGLAAWGLGPADRPATGLVLDGCRLLVLGGLVPLVLAAIIEAPAASATTRVDTWTAVATAFLALLGPLMAQELFVVGYAQTRFRDAFSPRAAIALVAIFFMLAHLGHVQTGIYGVVFVAAMGWQGVVWAAVRMHSNTLVPQLLAHGMLLLLYPYPRIAAVGVAVLGIVVLWGARPWAAEVLRSARRSA